MGTGPSAAHWRALQELLGDEPAGDVTVPGRPDVLFSVDTAGCRVWRGSQCGPHAHTAERREKRATQSADGEKPLRPLLSSSLGRGNVGQKTTEERRQRLVGREEREAFEAERRKR